MFMEACDLIGDYVEKYPYSFETVEETEIQPVYAGYPDESKENDEPLPKAGSDGAKGDETVHTVFVVFADNSIKRLKIDTGKPFKYLRNIQYLLGQIAGYCEFYTIELEKNSRVVDLKHLRKVCKSKIEQYDIFFEAVSGHINDYETLVVERKNESGGGLAMYENICGADYGPVIKLAENGTIEYVAQRAESPYIKVLLANNVKIINFPGYRYSKVL